MRSLLLLATVPFFLLSCSSGNKMQSSVQNDDVYIGQTSPYSQPEVNQSQTDNGYAPSENQDQYDQGNSSTDNTTSEKYSDENGTTYVTNNYYGSSGYDNYGNNSYASRLDRWYNPAFGFGYFSPFYTGFSYYDPFYSPGFNLSFNFGFGNGWYDPFYSPYSYNPWYSSFYNPWYSPFNYGYNNYGYGYYNGYYDGYYNGYYNGGGLDYSGNGYNNNNSYGPRGSVSGNTSNNGDIRQFKVADDAGSNSNGSVLHAAPGMDNVVKGKNTGVSPLKSVKGSDTKATPSGNTKSGVQQRQLAVPQNSNSRPSPAASPSHQNNNNNNGTHPRMNTLGTVSHSQQPSAGLPLPLINQQPVNAQKKNQGTVIVNPNQKYTGQNPKHKEQHYSNPVNDQPVKSQKSISVNNDRPSFNNNSTGSYNQDNSSHSSGNRSSGGGSRRR